MEQWADVEYAPKYEVSSFGRICGPRGDMNPGLGPGGYPRVNLCLGGSRRQKYYVHLLVALAFVPNPEKKPLVNHIDGCRTNPNSLNLEWVTHKENSERTVTHAKPGRFTKKVVQLTLDGEVVHIWNSITEAAKSVDAPISQISAVCRKIRGSFSAKGFGWEFFDNITIIDPDEVWEPIKEFGSAVAISSHGRVRTNCGHIIIGAMSTGGYLTVGDRQKFMVHRIVASVFCHHPDGSDIVNHKDGIKTNNKALNLEWCTPTENNNHAVQMGLTGQVQARARALIPDSDPIWVELESSETLGKNEADIVVPDNDPVWEELGL